MEPGKNVGRGNDDTLFASRLRGSSRKGPQCSHQRLPVARLFVAAPGAPPRRLQMIANAPPSRSDFRAPPSAPTRARRHFISC